MHIKVEQIGLIIGNKKILKGIDMELKDKEFLGIIGPNGSGKSTFLKCIYRVLKPTEGLIKFNGKALDELSFRETALQLAVVAQHNQYSFDFSVLDVVLMGRSPHKKMLERDKPEDYELARNALRIVGLQDFETRMLATLSGGEQQRTILARALTQQSECLVLDEPTNHLDIKYQLEILDIVKSLDVTVISAIHDLNLAALYCDRLIALKNGKIIGIGTPRELLTEEFIYELYEVHARVQEDEQGNLYIQFLPKHLHSNAINRPII